MNRKRKRLIVIGDRVLIRPDDGIDRTAVGLYLPQTVLDKDAVQSGIVAATGPGLALPDPGGSDEEPWKQPQAIKPQYIPLQARKGDFAMYVRSSAFELTLEGKKYFVVPYSAVLALLREDWETPELDREDPV